MLLSFINLVSQVYGSCLAENACQGDCSAAFSTDASSFPYDITYTTTANEMTTSFIVLVCGTSCETTSDACKALSTFQIRLSDDFLQGGILSASPEGAVVTSCAPRGPGYLYETDVQKGNCKTFTLTLDNKDKQFLTLSDICEQGISIVDETGAIVATQPAGTCLYVSELEDGLSGYGTFPIKVNPNNSPSPVPIPSPVPPPYAPVPPPYAPPPSYRGRILGQKEHRFTSSRLFRD